jgi:hypothetical protein
MNNFSTKKRIDYKTYLESIDWKIKKNQWVNSGRPLECWACGRLMPISRAGFDFHHRTYSNLGHENLNDLVLLCRTDHQLLSADWQKTKFIKGHCLRNETHMYIVNKRDLLGLSIKSNNPVMKYLGAFCE